MGCREKQQIIAASNEDTEYSELEETQPSSPAFKWTAHMGMEPPTLVLSVPCSDQLGWKEWLPLIPAAPWSSPP